jgi:hypothetical protein
MIVSHAMSEKKYGIMEGWNNGMVANKMQR